ncbi:RNA polymerase sigma factor SigJ [Brevibacillus borstelensis]|jgi:RNA polymerase sigma-70 factor (ECF subfamily)|uniref:RNA polymerase sigma factor SigJ n=1 Tax=Brevibacillus borstelensis TaxID=45462 RepID=UPI001FAA0DBC|nr:RNA polymerase sigma factor SigJ [Brevibacillus borstelensis]
MQTVEVEELYKSLGPSLISLAYRMMGSMMDAEDIVQETFLSIEKVPADTVRNAKAYLFRSVSNRCIDRLRAQSKHRETYAGPWLPEPIVSGGDGQTDPLEGYIRKETISMAYLLLIHQLSWTERVVFLLREVLQFEYEEIAEIVDKSSTNCRQIFRRAKRSLGKIPQVNVGIERNTIHLIEQFAQALLSGDMKILLETLTADTILYMDGGGKVKAPLRPLFGHDRIARFFIAILPEFPPDFSFTLRELNAQPGLVFYAGEQLFATISFDIQNDRIVNMYAVLNPDKLKSIMRFVSNSDKASPFD